MEEKEAVKTNKGKADNTTQNDYLNNEIAKMLAWVETMDRATIVRHLKRHNQNPNGSSDVLRRRLQYCLQKMKIAAANGCPNVKTLFPYYVVLDFEATCNEVNPPNFPHEIIEFPAVLVDTAKLVIVDKFQAFVKPVLNPVLTDFCKDLTGITQEQVDCAQEFPEVLAQFEGWLAKHQLGSKHKYAMVTDGPWDMGRFLYGQCEISNIPYPNFGKRWVNLRKIYAIFYKCERMRLQLMLERLGLQFEGHPHCGLDDAINIAHLLVRMIKDGASIETNERIQLRYKLDPKPSLPPSSNDENHDANATTQVCAKSKENGQ